MQSDPSDNYPPGVNADEIDDQFGDEEETLPEDDWDESPFDGESDEDVAITEADI